MSLYIAMCTGVLLHNHYPDAWRVSLPNSYIVLYLISSVTLALHG